MVVKASLPFFAVISRPFVQRNLVFGPWSLRNLAIRMSKSLTQSGKAASRFSNSVDPPALRRGMKASGTSKQNLRGLLSLSIPCEREMLELLSLPRHVCTSWSLVWIRRLKSRRPGASTGWGKPSQSMSFVMLLRTLLSTTSPNFTKKLSLARSQSPMALFLPGPSRFLPLGFDLSTKEIQFSFERNRGRNGYILQCHLYCSVHGYTDHFT
mmetsp:Transcript_26940/g.77685  ORF Transcript_26940/g.77685 Transcript_26940/m.77685 type:complete len:211 (+) Transcript_26940:1148-1780(+)